ncbi:MAG: hypothetical protein OXE96_15625 [Gemmatimonadetes bacterium]|nr:hypothetical protein [Gemmatimonadota bacterium]
MKRTTSLWPATLLIFLTALGGSPLASQEHELSMGSAVRITGATVLRGGPASPPRLYPTILEGSVVGMRGDTILFETGNEPVYWIPLGRGPLVERRAVVSDMKRSVLVTAAISGAAGATFALGLHDDCTADESELALGVAVVACPEVGTAGGAALRGFAIGTGIGAAVGVILSRFFKRQGWVAMPLDQIRFSAGPGGGWALSLPAGPGGNR